MPCYHPMIAIDVGQRTPEGKILYQIVSMPPGLKPGIHSRVRSILHDWVPCDDDHGFPFVTIPCGKCVGCRMEYSRQWANRCMLELQYHESAYFVTLTYSDYFVPISHYPDPETGEAMDSMTLRSRDLQLFMKRLRFRFSDQKIRFFACGEYGPTSWRPHYHLILFGLRLDDLVPVTQIRGHQYYSSQSLQEVWSCATETPSLFPGAPSAPGSKVPIGHISATDVTWETCAYTARYIMKKLSGPEGEFYDKFHLERPFVRMSLRPGLAHQWYDDHPGCCEKDYINISTPTGGKKFRPPNYYHKMFDIEQPEESARLKEIRQRMCTESIKAKLERTDLSYLEYMALEERNFKSRIKSLKREDV